MDFVYRNEVIDALVDWAKNETILTRLIEMNDDFINVCDEIIHNLQCNIVIDRDTFKWNSWNIFYNFWWDTLFVTIIVCVIWWYFCKLGRKHCAKKEAAKKEEKQALVFNVC